MSGCNSYGVPLCLANKGERVFAIVDPHDYLALRPIRWRFQTNKGKRYVFGQVAGRTVALHRHLLAPPPGMVVDHINGDPLDNRRANLRLATVQENVRNRRGTHASGFKGVVQTKSGRWRAHIGLGAFDTIEEAARAYDAAARIFHGEFARLNFPGADR